METLDEAPSADNAGAVVVGVDVGGSKIALTATDAETGDDLARDRFPTPTDVGPDALIEHLRDAILARVRERVARELDRPPALMRSVLGEDAQLYGATFGALQLLKEDEANLRHDAPAPGHEAPAPRHDESSPCHSE